MEVVSPRNIKSPISSQRAVSPNLKLKQLEVIVNSPFGLRQAQLPSSRAQPSNISSRLQNLLQGREIPSSPKIGLLKDIRSKRPLLIETEQKIFSQVIGLLDEIDELKQSIITSHQQIKKIQIQHPDVDQKVQYHGYSQLLTKGQCSDLEEENKELQKQIQVIENRQILSLQQVLSIEKQKYEQLKQELTESSDPAAANKAAEAKIAELKAMIAELQEERRSKVKMNYPGIDRLKNQNQELRQKTIANLKVRKLELQEERSMVEYLRKEEDNRNQFQGELKKFKAEFNRLKAENQVLREKLEKKKNENFKQNSSRRANEQKYTKSPGSPTSWQQTSTAVDKRGEVKDKLSQYQNFIKLMRDTTKQ